MPIIPNYLPAYAGNYGRHLKPADVTLAGDRFGMDLTDPLRPDTKPTAPVIRKPVRRVSVEQAIAVIRKEHARAMAFKDVEG